MIKSYLPELEELRKQIKKDPEATKKWLLKAEWWLGPDESIKEAKKFIEGEPLS